MAKLLEFEQPIKELYEKIDQLKLLSKDGKIDLDEEISKIEKRAEALKKDISQSLKDIDNASKNLIKIKNTDLV